MEFVYLGQETKMAAFDECVQKAGVREEEVAYMGDDLPDMPVAKRAGLAVAVANAAPELKAISHYVTKARGGDGTAREVVELILKAQGRWEEAIPRPWRNSFSGQTYSPDKPSQPQKPAEGTL